MSSLEFLIMFKIAEVWKKKLQIEKKKISRHNKKKNFEYIKFTTIKLYQEDSENHSKRANNHENVP